MGNFVGLLIRHKRLEQNLSQQGLCKGIYVVSYLSKIEQGLAEPSPEIVQQLLSALGVEYTTDPQLMEQGRAFIEDFFERINYGETEDPDAHAWLERQAQRLQNSPLYLDHQLYELFRLGRGGFQRPGLPHQRDAFEQAVRALGPFVPYMSLTQQFRYYWGASLDAVSLPQALAHLQKAALLQPCSSILYRIAQAYFAQGQYFQAIEQGERAYRAATDEGNLFVMRWVTLMIGSCYSGYPDLELCQRYFQRALALARGAHTAIPYLVQYNLGASYVERCRYDEALPHLEEALRLGENLAESLPDEVDEGDRLLTLHKLALAYGGVGQVQKARQACCQAEALLAGCPGLPPVCGDMIRLARMRLEPGYLDDAGYAAVLQQVYDTVEQYFAFGFKRFHSFMLIELYRHQRRYKEALAISESNLADFREIAK